jgi:hypothetical protein
MKNKILLFSLLCFVCASSFGQSLERSVVSTAGQEIKNANMSLEYTIGELMVGQTPKKETQLSQGFNQSYTKKNGAVSPLASLQAEVFPNPSRSIFSIKAENNLTFNVYDSKGVLIQEGKVQSSTTFELNALTWGSGVYQLILTNGLKSRKIVRLMKI